MYFLFSNNKQPVVILKKSKGESQALEKQDIKVVELSTGSRQSTIQSWCLSLSITRDYRMEGRADGPALSGERWQGTSRCTRPCTEAAASTKVTGERMEKKVGHMASAQADCITAERTIRCAGSFQSRGGKKRG